MNKILILLSLILIVSCGLSQEEKKDIAAVTCSIMSETGDMDAAIRVREMNDAREKIGGEPFLEGDSAIQEAFEWSLCQELVLNESYDETLQLLEDAARERERITRENQRIVDTKPSVKEEFHSNGELKSRTNYQPKSDGGKEHGLTEIYHENGQLHSKVNWKDGVRVDGLFETYDQNGQLESKGNYKDGKLDGLWEYFRENGQLVSKSNHKDGEFDGLWEMYSKNGELLFKDCYKNGEETDMSYCE